MNHLLKKKKREEEEEKITVYIVDPENLLLRYVHSKKQI